MKCAQAATAPSGVSGTDASNCLSPGILPTVDIFDSVQGGPLSTSLGSLVTDAWICLLCRKFGLIVPAVLVTNGTITGDVSLVVQY